MTGTTKQKADPDSNRSKKKALQATKKPKKKSPNRAQLNPKW